VYLSCARAGRWAAHLSWIPAGASRGAIQPLTARHHHSPCKSPPPPSCQALSPPLPLLAAPRPVLGCKTGLKAGSRLLHTHQLPRRQALELAAPRAPPAPAPAAQGVCCPVPARARRRQSLQWGSARNKEARSASRSRTACEARHSALHHMQRAGPPACPLPRALLLRSTRLAPYASETRCWTCDVGVPLSWVNPGALQMGCGQGVQDEGVLVRRP
jgi:hypothetical protein